MPVRKYKAEQIVTLLRQIEVQIANGKTAPQACKEAGIHTQTYDRWRREYGGLKLDQAKTAEGAGEGKYAVEATGGRVVAGEASATGGSPGKLLSPERRRCAVECARWKYGLSERRACRLLGQWRGTQRYRPMDRLDEDELTRAVVALAAQYGRYGYRRITALLQSSGWPVGKDRVQRIWRREGLKVPQKQRPRRRLWLNGGSCVRLRPEHRNHVWSYDCCQRQNARWKNAAASDAAGRGYEGMPGHPSRAEDRQPGGDRDVVGRDGVARGPGAYSIRQRPRVSGPGLAPVAGEAWDRNVIHRTRQSLGEWVL